jgi:hypothetical protein
MSRASAARNAPPAMVEEVDTSFLETLLGYNARRAALAAIDVFLDGMAPYQLKPVEFSVLSLVTHNPGITSRQLCTALGILPPNLVGLVNALEKRELIARQPHPARRPRRRPAPDRVRPQAHARTPRRPSRHWRQRSPRGCHLRNSAPC